MAFLAHNALLRVRDDGIHLYRVLFDAAEIGWVPMARVCTLEGAAPPKIGGRRRKLPDALRKHEPLPSICAIKWFEREWLIEGQDRVVFSVELEYDAHYLQEPGSSDQEIFDRRRLLAAPYLDLDHLRDEVLAHRSIATLITEVVERGASRSLAYKLFSLLVKYGFSERSLMLRRFRCGAPGVLRPCGDPKRPRKKAGRKTIEQLLDIEAGRPGLPVQPGMTADWRRRILCADARIRLPKPKMPTRCVLILNSSFVTGYREENGALVPADMKLGAYPNAKQIKHVLESDIPEEQRLAEKTTTAHFARACRGLNGRSWKGVSGPGHTWAIDSTVGDIYLRSSINRAWIIGRPIVYVLVDVWSTAVVGFYVCLEGPSWAMAKLSLFCAVADPLLLNALWGHTFLPALSPAPTLPAVLMCDRGEYLSQGARETSRKLLLCMSYAPPYRPEAKGIVEVLHRIAKDQTFRFVPGAIDARREEYELKRARPNESVFTVKEFVTYMCSVFFEYNLTADRGHRLDSHMRSEGVIASPAGLWRWGHEVGIGLQRALPTSELFESLLPSGVARVRRDGVRLMKRDYEAPSGWTTRARVREGWDVEVRYFPGSTSRIWTPYPIPSGFLELPLSDQSTTSHELTFDEAADAHCYSLRQNQQDAHDRLMMKLEAAKFRSDLVSQAGEDTAVAESKEVGARPTWTEARHFEIDERAASVDSDPRPSRPVEVASDGYVEMMRSVMGDMDKDA